MISYATFFDIVHVEDIYYQHIKHEIELGAFTVFKKGIYPTRKDTEKAINVGTLYVYEKTGSIAASIIIDNVQPIEYAGIIWGQTLPDNEVMVIHLLIVRPSMSGKGIASSLMRYAMEMAKNNSCKVLRLDTGSQNIPAISLYKKLGFQVIATASMKIGNTIAHKDHLFLEKVL